MGIFLLCRECLVVHCGPMDVLPHHECIVPWQGPGREGLPEEIESREDI